MTLALTRAVSPSIAGCALTFMDRQPIDVDLAIRQHAAYEDCLRSLGLPVISLPAEAGLPDAVFVEDTAVVLDEAAVMAAPGLPSRRPEVRSVAEALRPHRRLHFMTGTANLEGGDVLRLGRTLYAGLSARTNREGVEQLAGFVEPYGYRVQPVQFEGCLHLKSACTPIGRNTVLANRFWVDTRQLIGVDVVDVAPSEPGAGNALLVEETVVLPRSFPRTAALLEERGFTVRTVDVSELQKAEAGVTCCSILL